MVLTLLVLVLWLSICIWVVNKIPQHCELWVLLLMMVYWCRSRWYCVLCNDARWYSSYSQFCSLTANLDPILSLFVGLVTWTCLCSASSLNGRWGNNAISVLSQCHCQMSLYMYLMFVVSVAVVGSQRIFVIWLACWLPVSNSAVVAYCWTVM